MYVTGYPELHCADKYPNYPNQYLTFETHFPSNLALLVLLNYYQFDIDINLYHSF